MKNHYNSKTFIISLNFVPTFIINYIVFFYLRKKN
jgi:hypothetical protein